ncbi:MAG TPA: aminotransferase class III-fold pyridoxal phosphate-dependent enzyme [Kofleriaceae bacterium]|nr:aminotransferase class III-fold pyridoxal phosphate-dependent enzyme [Kofleriaceae bacterium]
MATSAGDEDVRARYERHVNPTFVKLLGLLGYGRVLVRARGATVWDDRERAYIDLLAGFGALNLGHNHPGVLAAIRAVLDREAVHLCHTGPTGHEGAFAAALAAAAGPPLDVALLSSTGAEAVEAGIKLARAATGRNGTVYCDGGFHGLSLGTLSIMGAPRLRAPFGRLLGDTVAVPFGDTAALERALAGDRMAAFVVEPIQAEAGVILPPRGYLAAAQEACRRHGTLLVLDEVQTGLGRTGTMFAYQAEGFVPDVLVLAKALGGGVVPVGATLVARALHQRAYGALDRFDAHGSTFAGNALACAAGEAALALTASLDLPGRAARLGDRLRERLTARLRGHPLVREVRGRGLLVGVEVGTPVSNALAGLSSLLADALAKVAPPLGRSVPGRFVGQWLAVRMLEAGVLCQPASHQWDVLKLEPPLTIEEEELDRAADALGDVLDEYRGLPALVRDLGARLASQGQRGWSW